MSHETMQHEGDPAVPVTISVRVRNVEQALAFYRHAFEAEMAPDETQILYPGGVRTLAIHVIAEEDGGTASEEPEDPLTPRCELVVDDVDAWVDRAVSLGAQVKAWLVDAHGRVTYAQLTDPFGHLWAVAASCG